MKKRLLIAIVLITVGLICTTAIAKKQIEEKRMPLPGKVTSALMSRYPGAEIEKVHKENPEAVVFEIVLELKDGKEIEVLTAADGTLLVVENEIEAVDLPFDLATSLPGNAHAREVESKITHAELKPIVLAEPVQTYEVEAIVDGKNVEFLFDTNGTIIKQEIEDEEHGSYGYKGNTDNDNEEKDDKD